MKILKALSITAVMALGLVVFPSMASAQGGVEADQYPVSYVGVPETPALFTWAAGLPAYCNNVTTSGEAAGPSDNLGSISSMSCQQEGGGGKTEKALTMNGCKFEFHPGTSSSIDIGPPGCGPIKGLQLFCSPTIPAQTGIPATYENVTVEGHERVRVSTGFGAANLKVNCTGGGGEGEHIYFQDRWLVSGYQVPGPLTNIRRGTALDGFFIAGKKSESPAEQPHFTAESYPDPITGSLNSGQTFKVGLAGGIEVTCTGAAFSASLSAATTALPLATTLSGCNRSDPKSPGGAATFTMHSCRISYGLSNVDYIPPLAYKGTIGVDCTKAGDYIGLSFEGCETRIPAQSPSTSSVVYVNDGSGKTRFVRLNQATASGLIHTYETGFCTLVGKEQTNGSLTIGQGTLTGI